MTRLPALLLITAAASLFAPVAAQAKMTVNVSRGLPAVQTSATALQLPIVITLDLPQATQTVGVYVEPKPSDPPSGQPYDEGGSSDDDLPTDPPHSPGDDDLPSDPPHSSEDDEPTDPPGGDEDGNPLTP